MVTDFSSAVSRETLHQLKMASQKSVLNTSINRDDASGGSDITCTSKDRELMQALEQKRLWSSRENKHGEDWCCSHSLSALGLTLQHIVEDCRLPNHPVLEEFPCGSLQRSLPVGALALHTLPEHLPSPARVHLDCDKLSQKADQLKSMIKLYENRIQWLSTGSRLNFGYIKGSKVVVLVESSDKLAQDGSLFDGLSEALKMLMSEQLHSKEAVYLVNFGTEPDTDKPKILPFKATKIQCLKSAFRWLSTLHGSGGSCDLLGALRVALKLQDIDTVCVVLSTEPNQKFEVVTDYMVDELCGDWIPSLHLVAFNSSDSTASSLERMARQTNSNFHRVAFAENSSKLIEDSDILKIQEEIAKAEKAIKDISNLQSGTAEGCLSILRELSLATDVEWPTDDDLTALNATAGDHSRQCSTLEWLKEYNFVGCGLSLYQFLAPNAYPQLDGFVEIIDKKIISQVYDVMPAFGWHDDSIKYLHVDVRGLERYQKTVEAFILEQLSPRLDWLISGSRVPFGVIADNKVLLVLDSSYLVLTETQVLQHQLRVLLQEQLAHVEEFNLMRFGGDCCVWSSGFVKPSRQSLQDAWEWVLGLSPAGTCDLMAALKHILEGSSIFSDEEHTSVGIYLQLSAMPNQDIEHLCSYIEQMVSGKEVKVHVIFHDMEWSKSTSGRVEVPGREGGRYGSAEEMEEACKSLAMVGSGSFHHFRVSGSVNSDDIALLKAEICEAQTHLQMATDILNHYRTFCKRYVPPPSPDESPDNMGTRQPPTHPRQTNASLAKMNACLQRKRSKAERRPRTKSKKKVNITTQCFYLGRELRKGMAWNITEGCSPTKMKARPLIPCKEECVSSNEWLLKYGLKTLDLSFDKLVPSQCHSKQNKQRVVHKHINHKGELVDLLTSHQGLKAYMHKLHTAVNRYQLRMEWLQKDNHKYFGVVSERTVVFLIDVSSSMCLCLDEVKQGMTVLLQNNPAIERKSFPQFQRDELLKLCFKVARGVGQYFRGELLIGSELAARYPGWREQLSARSTEGFQSHSPQQSLKSGADGVYLVTDGASDHTHEFLLSQLPVLRKLHGNGWRINAVAFHSKQEESKQFLRTLATETGGRYHCYPLPTLEVVNDQRNTDHESLCDTVHSEDLDLMHREIQQARLYLTRGSELL